MKIRFLLSLIILLSRLATAQNLVPNSSFEQYSICPDLEDQVERATGWSKYSESSSTPDYYNACATPPYFSVPQAGGGYQQAHNNGNAFIGLGTFTRITANHREMVGIQLSQPLTIGQKYFISFYTVMSEQYTGSDYFGHPANNIGIRLSTVSYNGSNPAPINNIAHVYSSTVINDSINWNLISGSIIADSAYNYLIVGNFFDDASTDTINYNCGSCLNYYSYYYVDDICVSTDSALCNTIQSIPEIGLQHSIAYPVPANQFIYLKVNGSIESGIIVNVLGQTVTAFNSTYKNKENEIEIDCSAWPTGVYFLKTKKLTHKIIVQH